MKLTIITINYNNASGLNKTMASVFSQTSKDFEYIVVDGGSTDGSVEVIKEFSALPYPIFSWISEKDNGVYHAMNKGIRMAKGEYVQFLNSGDMLAGVDVTERMLKDMPECSFLSGDMQLMKNGKRVKWKGPRTEEISFMTLYTGTVNHSPTYIKRSLFDRYGFYDEQFKIVSDWKFFLVTIALNNESIVLKRITVTKFDLSGISSTNMELRLKERRMVLEELIPRSILKDYDVFCRTIIKIKCVSKYKVVSLFFELIYRMCNKIDKIYYTIKS